MLQARQRIGIGAHGAQYGSRVAQQRVQAQQLVEHLWRCGLMFGGALLLLPLLRECHEQERNETLAVVFECESVERNVGHDRNGGRLHGGREVHRERHDELEHRALGHVRQQPRRQDRERSGLEVLLERSVEVVALALDGSVAQLLVHELALERLLLASMPLHVLLLDLLPLALELFERQFSFLIVIAVAARSVLSVVCRSACLRVNLIAIAIIIEVIVVVVVVEVMVIVFLILMLLPRGIAGHRTTGTGTRESRREQRLLVLHGSLSAFSLEFSLSHDEL